MMNIKELNKLVKGEKYTLYYNDFMGLTIKLEITYLNHIFGQWAQHDNSLYITLRQKNKRKDTTLIIPENSFFTVLKGWNNVDGVRKEAIKETESATLSKLHFKKSNDFKNDTNLLINKREFEKIENNNDESIYEWLLDETGDYIYNNNLKPVEAPESEGYRDFIRSFLNDKGISINNNMMNYFKEYSLLVKTLKAIV